MLEHSQLAVVAVAALASAMFGLFRSKEERSQYGDARFANLKEIRASGLLEGDGILVGKSHGRHLFFGGQQFVLVAAPTRAGKGIGIVIPNLLTFRGSVVVLDIKGENFDRSAEFRRRHGQAIYKFSPFSEGGARFNPLASLSPDPKRRFGEVMAMATAIYPTSGDNPFWNEQAANLFVGLVLYLCEDCPGTATFTKLLGLVSTSAGVDARKAVTRLVQNKEATNGKLSEACSGALARFAANSEAAASGVLSSFYAPLLVFADPMVAKATEVSDFDIAMVRDQLTSIYVCIEPQHLKSARVILNVFFTQLIFANTQELAGDTRHNISCLLLMDEFTSVGRIDILAHSIAFMSAYNLRLVSIVQSIAQLTGTYGEHDARTLLANHALRIVFAPNELRDAREVSEMLGMTTLSTRQVSQTRSRGGAARHSESHRIAKQPRALLLPQELRSLGRDLQLVLLDGHRPILANKIRYFEEPELSSRAVPQGR